MRIIVYPKYSAMGPSSRYRMYEYLHYLEKEGIDYVVKPLLGDWYLTGVWHHQSKAKVGLHIIWAYLKRIVSVLFLHSNDVVWIGAELLPSFPGWMEKYMKLRGIVYVLEFDDAVFHNYDKKRAKITRRLYADKFEKVIRNASTVICGCRYLADYSKRWNTNVIIIPTCVDREKYNVALNNENKLVIGWIGSPSSSSYIEIVIEALKELMEEVDFELHLIGFDRQYEHLLEGINYRIKDWANNTEIEDMTKFSIGIMPLPDTPFSRGKCAFKLVQYMAMGIPTISTPLQSNVDIDRGCGNLFANNTDEWHEAFTKLMTDRGLREQIGVKNKEIALKYYTFQATWQSKINIIKSSRKFK